MLIKKKPPAAEGRQIMTRRKSEITRADLKRNTRERNGGAGSLAVTSAFLARTQTSVHVGGPGPIDGQQYRLRFGLKVTRSRPRTFII
jgi:hypothetical protein